MDFDECIAIVLDMFMHCHCLRNIPMHFHFVRNIRSFCCRCVTYVWSCVPNEVVHFDVTCGWTMLDEEM